MKVIKPRREIHIQTITITQALHEHCVYERSKNAQNT